MPQEYKIFFNDRVVYLTGKITKSFEKNEGLFFKYSQKEQLAEMLDAFGRFSSIRSLYVFSDDEEKTLEQIKSCYKIVEAAGGVIRNADGKLLVIFRRGKWDLPKGKIEKGEFYSQAALREVQEETGLTKIELGKHLFDTYHVYTEKGQQILKRTIWYNMTLTADEKLVPQQEEDITEVRWIDYQGVGEVMKNTFESLKDIFMSMKKS
jgi:8-oxo-dGTP pyrophosphatase MutT (NUDIX family)